MAMRKTGRELSKRMERRIDPFEEFDRVIETMRAGLSGALWMPSPGPPGLWDTDARPAPVDLRDAGSEFILTAEVPGVQKDEVDVEVSEDGAEIRAQVVEEREEEQAGYHIKERTHGSWYRRVPFPVDVLPARAEAELRDGVLTLRVPKKEAPPERGARKVPIA